MSQTPAPAAPVATAAPRNFLSEDVEIKGTVMFESALHTNGRIHGEILSSGTLTVGKTGAINGNIQASAVSVHGTVTGNITVQDRCELRGDAELIGDLDAPRLVIEEGVTFVGNVKVLPAASRNPATTKAPAK
jgi:cytoskeletal protein CcmA (bactofilin family)